MPRTYDPAKTCLKLGDWPAIDQRLWESILVGGDPEDEFVGAGAAWRPYTVRGYRVGYGRWLSFLQRSGVDMSIPPADRVTPERVTSYRQELQD